MEWKTVKLGDCLSKIIDNRGKTPKDLAASGHPLLEINAVSKNNKYPLYGEAKKYVDDVVYSTWFRSGHPQYGDILVPTVGTLGAVAYVDRNDCCIAQNLIALRANADICDSAYIYYLLCNPQIVKRLLNLDIGAVQASIKVPHLLALEILLPSLETQRRIATILSSLDDKIENNNRINRNLEAQAQALFKSWFVDFEPWGGTMPEDWKKGSTEDFFTINIGKTPPRQEKEWFSLDKKNRIWVSISDMASCGVFISDSSEYLTKEAVDKFNIVMVPKDSILLSFKLTIGRVAITQTELTTNEAIARFILPNPIYREYLYLLLKKYNYGQLGSTSSIATAVNSKIIKKMSMVMPTEEVLRVFNTTAKPLFEQIANNQRESHRLAALRDTLLPKLMKGEIEV